MTLWHRDWGIWPAATVTEWTAPGPGPTCSLGECRFKLPVADSSRARVAGSSKCTRRRAAAP